MELFLPSILVFLLVTLVVMYLLPKLSPLIIVSLAATMLAFGIYHHFTLFWNDYRQSTWQDQLRLFAPGIMLTVILVYVIFSIFMFFTWGQVPVPSIPAVQLPSANTATNAVTSAINNAMKAVLPASVNENNQKAAPLVERNNGNNGNNGNNNGKKNNNGVTRSFLATI